MKLIASTCAAAVAALALGAAASAQDWSLNPTYGTVNLNTGFLPDPHSVSLQSGGPIDAGSSPALAGASGICRGYIANAPDYRLNYSAGSTFPLIISVNSSSDTTLVVNAPNGAWYCDDDGGEGLNPSMRFDSPMSGQYDIWVGTYGAAALAPAVLAISEVGSH